MQYALSKHDVKERIILWEFCRPYGSLTVTIVTVFIWTGILISAKFASNGPYQEGTLTTGIMKDAVWDDFEKKILSPELEERIYSDNNKIYSFCVLLNPHKDIVLKNILLFNCKKIRNLMEDHKFFIFHTQI
jgi:hypothetical protein